MGQHSSILWLQNLRTVQTWNGAAFFVILSPELTLLVGRHHRQSQGDGRDCDPEASVQDRAARAGTAASRPAQRPRQAGWDDGQRVAQASQTRPPGAQRPRLHHHGDRPAVHVVSARLGAGSGPGPPVHQQAGVAEAPLPHLLRPALMPGSHVPHAAR